MIVGVLIDFILLACYTFVLYYSPCESPEDSLSDSTISDSTMLVVSLLQDSDDWNLFTKDHLKHSSGVFVFVSEGTYTLPESSSKARLTSNTRKYIYKEARQTVNRLKEFKTRQGSYEFAERVIDSTTRKLDEYTTFARCFGVNHAREIRSREEVDSTRSNREIELLSAGKEYLT